MIESVKIKNFRGIDSLELSKCKPFNIIVGGNGVGKTTVLEAITLTANGNAPNHITAIAFYRGQINPAQPGASDLFIRTMFKDLKSETPINLSLVVDSEKSYELKIEHDKETFLIGDDQTPVMVSPSSIRALKLSYSHPRKAGSEVAKHVSQLQLLSSTKVQIKADSLCKHCISAAYLPLRVGSNPNELAEKLSGLVREKRKGELISALKSIEPRIIGIELSAEGGLNVPMIDLKGNDSLLPAQVLGDGFNRSLLLTLTALAQNKTVINVDEIDAGIHHSAMKKHWLDLIRLQRKTEFQLFCTSHNEEMIQQAKEAFADSPELVSVFRIEREPDGSINASHRDFEALEDLLSGGYEVR